MRCLAWLVSLAADIAHEIHATRDRQTRRAQYIAEIQRIREEHAA